MDTHRGKKIAWFRSTDRCQFSDLSVTNPEILEGADPENHYCLEIAKLGDQILLLKASGFVTSLQMIATLRYSDEYISKYFDKNLGILVIEDYRNVTGADFEARKKYFDYYKNRKFFMGAVLYNMLPLIKVSFNLARRLHFYNENAYAVESYEEAVHMASKILRRSVPTQINRPVVRQSVKNSLIASVPGKILKNKYQQKATLLTRPVSAIISRFKGMFIKEYSEALLKFMESIDWNKEGIPSIDGSFYANTTFREVPEKINFIKAEVDNLIKERLKAEKILLKNEARLRQLVEHSKAAIWEYDYGSGKIISTNNALADITGYTKEEILSMRPVDFLTEESRKKFKERLSLLHSGETISPDVIYAVKTKNGDVKWVLANANILYRNHRPMKAEIVLTDITPLKTIESKLLEYQSKLKGLTIQLSMSEEKQRRMLASELHDKISQELFVTQLRLEAFNKSLDNPVQIQEISRIKDHVVQLIRDARNLINDISPPVLYDFGFQEAIEALARATESKFNLRVTTDFSGDADLVKDDIKIVLYRNIKEIIHNTVKHANAANLHISSHQSKKNIDIFIKDDGVGFDMESLSKEIYSNKGFGLFDIREKMNHLGGFFEIHSVPGAGISISMKVPLP